MKKITIKNRSREVFLFKRRLAVVMLIVCTLLVVLIARLIYLQVFQHPYYTTLSRQNDISLKPIPPRRGLIYDRHGILLAENVPVFSLVMTPSNTPHFTDELAELEKILPLSADELREFYQERKQKRAFDATLLKDKLTPKQVAIFSVNRFKFPGFSVQARLLRNYPKTTSVADVVGYVGRINATDLQNLNNANYAATNYIGKRGIEKYFESQLHGSVGYEEIETNAQGAFVRHLGRVPAKSGVNLYLTIDTSLQTVAEAALKKLRGSIVVMNPQNGEILALVSHPSYDPNLFVTGLTQQAFLSLQNDPDHPLYNRAVTALYAPGSTIKPFIALEGLDAKVITPETKVYDPGWFVIKGTHHVFHNYNRGGFGWVNLNRAILLSDDTYFYQLATELGIGRIEAVLTNFGFGQKTGIEIPGELSGIVPSPDYKMRISGQAWYTGDTVITGIGQGFTQVTAVQLAQATATLAMRGHRFQPQLLSAYEIPGGRKIRLKPRPLTPVQLKDPHYWDVVIDAMQNVITSGTGGIHFGKPPYPVAAKTGTAQVYTIKNDADTNQALPERERDNSLFIAFAPIKNPEIALAVVVENDSSAPQVARKVMDAYFNAAPHLPAQTATRGVQ